MIIRVKDGSVTKFADHGSMSVQMKNMNALIDALQKYAGQLQIVAGKTLMPNESGKGSFIEDLVRENKTLRQTVELAQKQLRKNQAANGR